jgi:hypothetical protein
MRNWKPYSLVTKKACKCRCFTNNYLCKLAYVGCAHCIQDMHSDFWNINRHAYCASNNFQWVLQKYRYLSVLRCNQCSTCTFFFEMKIEGGNIVNDCFVNDSIKNFNFIFGKFQVVVLAFLYCILTRYSNCKLTSIKIVFTCSQLQWITWRIYILYCTSFFYWDCKIYVVLKQQIWTASLKFQLCIIKN